MDLLWGRVGVLGRRVMLDAREQNDLCKTFFAVLTQTVEHGLADPAAQREGLGAERGLAIGGGGLAGGALRDAALTVLGICVGATRDNLAYCPGFDRKHEGRRGGLRPAGEAGGGVAAGERDAGLALGFAGEDRAEACGNLVRLNVVIAREELAPDRPVGEIGDFAFHADHEGREVTAKHRREAVDFREGEQVEEGALSELTQREAHSAGGEGLGGERVGGAQRVNVDPFVQVDSISGASQSIRKSRDDKRLAKNRCRAMWRDLGAIMRITRVYTRTGDHGTTRLVMGREVPKDHPRIEAYGDVDELNAVLGVALASFTESGPEAQRLRGWLERVQHELFDLGADLATRAEDRWPGMHRLGDEEIARLEAQMDEISGQLPPLEEFILPGGGIFSATLHQARTVCRRAERRVATLMAVEEIGGAPLRYLNRLSDALFVFSREGSRLAGAPEVYWRNPNRRA